jgi:hypothetical protein
MSNFLTAFTLKSVRIEWFTSRDVAVAEYERQNEHLSEAEVYALYEHAKKQDALEREAAAAAEEDCGDHNHQGAGGVGGSGGNLNRLNSHDEYHSPNLMVDGSLMRQLHKSMNHHERESVGHMSKRRLRSSFVDNASAVLGRASFARTPSKAAAAEEAPAGSSGPSAAAVAATAARGPPPPPPLPPAPPVAPPSISSMPPPPPLPQDGQPEDRTSDSSATLNDSNSGGIRMSTSFSSHSNDSKLLPPLTPPTQPEPANESGGAAVDSSDI